MELHEDYSDEGAQIKWYFPAKPLEPGLGRAQLLGLLQERKDGAFHLCSAIFIAVRTFRPF